MRAIFEVEFNPDDMIDKKTLDEEYGGSWFKFMKYLYGEEGMGIFNKDFKLIKVTTLKSKL